jgi:CubicO group peptidase (beta-lactamase class C family)
MISCGVAGTMSFRNHSPMNRSTIFRIASITKPIAAAAMILVKECKLRLNDECSNTWQNSARCVLRAAKY